MRRVVEEITDKPLKSKDFKGLFRFVVGCTFPPVETHKKKEKDKMGGRMELLKSI